MNLFVIGFILVAVLIVVCCILYIAVKDAKQKKEVTQREAEIEKEKRKAYEKQIEIHNKYKNDIEGYTEDLRDSDGNFNYDGSVELLQKLRKDGEKRTGRS